VVCWHASQVLTLASVGSIPARGARLSNLFDLIPHGVMAARDVLAIFVWVRILVGELDTGTGVQYAGVMCKVCGLYESLGGRYGKICRVCYREKNKARMRQVYWERRTAALEQLGGVCVDCGLSDNLEFDHVYASEKEYQINSLFSGGSSVKLAAELAKCVLRCYDCHKLKSAREGDCVPVRRRNMGLSYTG
jgi:5-methylcytosine-specific restriction endonuclease McrA